MIKMSLFDCVKDDFRVYPEVLGYYYLTDITEHPEKLKAINRCDFVFVTSDCALSIDWCFAHQFMTSAEDASTFMWLDHSFDHFVQMPHSEWTEVPTVGFVGRCPVFKIPGKPVSQDVPTFALHEGFEPRMTALDKLNRSNEICCDFHIRMAPSGDSAGFWNETNEDFRRHQPLFKTNMLANQYQVCARGNANWSLRFYETLAYGRIPVYVESGGRTAADWWYGEIKDRVNDLPFVYVKDIADIEWEILKFHNSIDSLAEIQDMCRQWYMDNYSTMAQWKAFESAFAEYRK